MNAHPAPLRSALAVRRERQQLTNPTLSPRLQADRAQVLEHVQDLLPGAQIPLADLDLLSLADIEKFAVLRRLNACDGNVRDAARRLGISAATLRYKLRNWTAEPLTPSLGGRTDAESQDADYSASAATPKNPESPRSIQPLAYTENASVDAAGTL
jgi:DNA-binding protein Fis